MAAERKPKLACASHIGRMARIFEEQDILRLLRAAVEQEGNQSAFAKRYRVQRTSINLILARKRRVSEAIKNALGLRTPNQPVRASRSVCTEFGLSLRVCGSGTDATGSMERPKE
jgi:hypothetical protein